MTHKQVIQVNNLTKLFDGVPAVDGIDLDVKKGEVFGFLGPNGSGKTTTLRMLCGLLTPDKGEGTCLGYDIIRESKQIKKNIGYMTQHFSFYTDLSVRENLNFIANVYGLSERKQRVEAIMLDFNLNHRQSQLAGELSGGWKQRLALAACMLHKPKLLLLDEPTSGIDPIARREFWNRIHALSEEGITTLLTTHYMDEAERCTRLAYIANAKLVVKGTVEEVIKSTGLTTWEVVGDISPQLLSKVKEIPGVTQAAFFGRHIHVCGFEDKQIEHSLEILADKKKITFYKIDSTLEDAFLRLVNQTHTGEQ